MNHSKRLERLEAKRKNQASSVSSDFADAKQQLMAKLDALGARLRAAGQAPIEIAPDELSARIAMVRQSIERAKEVAKQPKAASWLKLQRKAK